MKIKILGTACAKCNSLEKLTRKAVAELKLDATIEKVGDIDEILKYSVMRTPALIIDEKVLITGQVPSLIELKSLLIGNLTKL